MLAHRLGHYSNIRSTLELTLLCCLGYKASCLACVGKMKWNGGLGHLCAHNYRLNGAWVTSWWWWDEWDDTALQTQDSNIGGLRPSSLLLGHRGSPQYWIFYERTGKKHSVSLKLECQSGERARDLRLSKQAALTTAPGPPPLTCVGRESSQ